MKTGYIIFADDDADDLDLIINYFKKHNPFTRVLQLKDGKEVLAHLNDLSTELPLAIVLDINMPRLNGKETLKLIRQNSRYRYIPVIVYSTSVSQADESFCKLHQASWLSKPESLEGINKAAQIIAEFCDIESSRE